MKRKLQRNAEGALVWPVFILLAFIVSAPAQIITPLHISARQAITDEMGRRLQGSYADPCDYVQVLWASNGVIYPPSVDGRPHPDNPPASFGISGIGHMAVPSQSNPGVFALSVTDGRPANGSKIFVRVFNASTPEASTFYGDSEILTVSGNRFLNVEIASTSTPLDAGDDDSDGVNNSWEESLGLNPNAPDTDDDGMKDNDELRAGTDPLNRYSYFAVSSVTPESGGLRIAWQSVPGKTYRIQRTDDILHPDFTDIGEPVIASGSTTEIYIENEASSTRGIFRIKVEAE